MTSKEEQKELIKERLERFFSNFRQYLCEENDLETNVFDLALWILDNETSKEKKKYYLK